MLLNLLDREEQMLREPVVAHGPVVALDVDVLLRVVICLISSVHRSVEDGAP